MRALVKRMGDVGVGIFEVANEHHAVPALQRDYLDRLREVAVESGRPVTFIVGWSASSPQEGSSLLRLCEEAASEGGRMFGQSHSREFMSVIGFGVHLPFDSLSGWKEVRSRPLAAQRAALEDPAIRSRLVQEALRGELPTAIGAESRPPDYDNLRVVQVSGPARTVAEVASARGVSPVDALIDLSLEAGLDQFFAQPFANQDMGELLRMRRHPHAVVGGPTRGPTSRRSSIRRYPRFCAPTGSAGNRRSTGSRGFVS